MKLKSEWHESDSMEFLYKTVEFPLHPQVAVQVEHEATTTEYGSSQPRWRMLTLRHVSGCNQRLYILIIQKTGCHPGLNSAIAMRRTLGASIPYILYFNLYFTRDTTYLSNEVVYTHL